MKKIVLLILYKVFVNPWLRYIIGVRFENRQALKKHKQFIIIANHNSHFDTVAILASLDIKNLINTSPAAAIDYFGKNRLSRFLTTNLLNTILIFRQKVEGKPGAIEQLDSHLKLGKSLLLFPEGTRGTAGEISDFKSGIAVLLKKNPGLPFIPVYLIGFGRVLPKDGNIIVPLNCLVRYGEPIVPNSNLSIDEILELTKTAVLSLRESDDREHNKFAFD
ncbi:MAG: 1-acyl-sn-glycerol-3-phosphate acyltransferase [Bacteroidia bacterium]|nr:1-acyl-sn-glycerol-3-phosphate acyltransferase [Bacteroidia bacterium]NNJ55610.1 1-acyl-sn-glycerol-3-phosphate acyltransferase [Bacteroidia bacterium]